jgi:hypothetical protein
MISVLLGNQLELLGRRVAVRLQDLGAHDNFGMVLSSCGASVGTEYHHRTGGDPKGARRPSRASPRGA